MVQLVRYINPVPELKPYNIKLLNMIDNKAEIHYPTPARPIISTRTFACLIVIAIKLCIIIVYSCYKYLNRHVSNTNMNREATLNNVIM